MARPAAAKRSNPAHLIPLLPSADELAPHQIAHEVATNDRSMVDEWGRDPRLVRTLSPLAALRWDVSVGGAEHIRGGGALIVINTRRFALTPIFAAMALGEALDRPARFVGRPDIVPLGPFLRRIGGLLAQPAEIAGALRAGEIVVVGAAGTNNARHAGVVDHEFVAAALRERVPVYVAATLSTMTGRQARVGVGAALSHTGTRRGPLAEVELAERIQHRLQTMLDELGPTRPDVSWPSLRLLTLGRGR